MPMRTQLIRTAPVQLRWGAWHLNRLFDAMKEEVGEAATYWPTTYTFTSEHTFTDESDGEVFTILVGDTYETWRD